MPGDLYNTNTMELKINQSLKCHIEVKNKSDIGKTALK